MKKDNITRGALPAAFVMASLFIAVPARGIAEEGQETSLVPEMVRPAFRNESPGPNLSTPGAALFNGHVGPYSVPADESSPPEMPSGGGFRLDHSAFGQACSPYVAYVDFERHVTIQARNMLFLQEYGGGVGRLVSWELTIVWQEGLKTYEAELPMPLAIPTPGAVTSAIAVGDTWIVGDVDVKLQIEHTWDEDLEVSLRSPSGLEIVLFSGVGGGGDNFGDGITPLTLDDAADVPIREGVPPFAGEFQPQDPLTLFNGENAMGTWTLTIGDVQHQDPSAEPPAFRFIDELYTNDAGTPANILEDGLRTEAEIDTLLDEWYGPDEMARIAEAETLVRDALAYAPFDNGLRNVLLDIFYYRCVANTLLAKEKLVRAYGIPIIGLLDTPVINQEIASFEEALAAYRPAANPYFELFNDGMGVRVADIDPSAPADLSTAPFGYYVFVKEVPGRSLYAATFRDDNGDPQPVVAAKSGQPATLCAGYKDWALLFDLMRDEAVTARQLAVSYLMRGETGDADRAAQLIKDLMGRMEVEGDILLGMFPDTDPDELPLASGIPQSIANWQTAVSDLEGVRQFMDGEVNWLGFREDFLMLVQGMEEVRDSFDALLLWNDADDSSSPLGAADQAHGAAVNYYDTYRGLQDDLYWEFSDLTRGYRDRLQQITGVDPGPDPANPHHAAYLTPEQNQGSEINQLVRSIEIAINQVRQNSQEIANLKEKVQIEVDRRAQASGIRASIADLQIQFGEAQADYTEMIAEIEAKQVRAQNLCDAANCISYTAGVNFPTGGTMSVSVSGGLVAYGVNAYVQHNWEKEKGNHEADKERLAGLEQARITAKESELLTVESEANIKTWLLGMKTLQLESQGCVLQLNQEVARLTQLYNEKATMEARLSEVTSGLSWRYEADPIHRLRYQAATLEAQKKFEIAQKWVYFTLQAFAYKHNIPGFLTPDGYSLNSVFAARNALELKAIARAVKDYDLSLGLPGGIPKEDWLSYTEDILGHRILDDRGNPVLYTCPHCGGADVPASHVLRCELQKNMDESGVVTLHFSTVLDNGESFFYGPRYDASGALVTPGSFLDKINYMKINLRGNHSVANTRVGAALTQGGDQYVRDRSVGVQVAANKIEGEWNAWTTRFWFMDPGDSFADPPILPGWRFNEGLTANIAVNLTSLARDEAVGNAFDEFAERSVAADDWRLVIFTREGNETRLNIDELEDVEIYFNHRSKNRPFKKSEEEG